MAFIGIKFYLLPSCLWKRRGWFLRRQKQALIIKHCIARLPLSPFSRFSQGEFLSVANSPISLYTSKCFTWCLSQPCLMIFEALSRVSGKGFRLVGREVRDRLGRNFEVRSDLAWLNRLMNFWRRWTPLKMHCVSSFRVKLKFTFGITSKFNRSLIIFYLEWWWELELAEFCWWLFVLLPENRVHSCCETSIWVSIQIKWK